jgi:hypothetical protein
MAAATLRGSSNAKVIQQGFLLVLVSSDRIRHHQESNHRVGDRIERNCSLCARMIAACDRGPIRTPVFTRIAESGRLLQEQCTGGDFSQTVPAGADAYILRWIIHDWSEVQAVVLLGKIREGMKPGARLMLLEELIPETPDLVPGKWIDVLMLAITGGRERTQKEYSELLSAANFELEDVVPTTGPLSILIAKARYTV